MPLSLLEKTLNIPAAEIKRILALPEGTAFSDPEYLDLVKRIDLTVLRRTAAEARAAFERGLPRFSKEFRRKYRLPCPVTSYTLSMWMIELLKKPEELADAALLNIIIPRDIMAQNLQPLIDMLDAMPPTGRVEWQRTLVTILLPLMEDVKTEASAQAGA